MKQYLLDPLKSVMAVIEYPPKDITLWDISGYQSFQIITIACEVEMDDFKFAWNKDFYAVHFEQWNKIDHWTADSGWKIKKVYTMSFDFGHNDWAISKDNLIIVANDKTIAAYREETRIFSFFTVDYINNITVDHSSLITYETFDGKLFCNETLVFSAPTAQLSIQYLSKVNKVLTFCTNEIICYDLSTKAVVWTAPIAWACCIDVSLCESMIYIYVDDVNRQKTILNTASGHVLKDHIPFLLGFHREFSKIIIEDDTQESMTKCIDLFSKSSMCSLLYPQQSSFFVWKMIERKLFL